MKRATKRRKRHVIPGPAGLLQQRQQFRKHDEGNDCDPNHDASGTNALGCVRRKCNNSVSNSISRQRSSSLMRKVIGKPSMHRDDDDDDDEDCIPGKDDSCENDEEECLFHLSDSKTGKSFPRRVSQKIHEHVQIWDAMCVALNRTLPTWSNNNTSRFYEDPYSNLQLRKALGGDYTLLSDIPHLDTLKIPKIVLQIHYIYSHGHCNYTVEVLDESITKPEIGWLSQDLIRNHPEWIRAGTVFLCCNVSLAVFHNERNVNHGGSNGSEYDGQRRTVETFDRMLVLGEENIVFAWTKENVGDVSHGDYLNLLEKRSEVEQDLMIMVGHDDVDEDAEVGDLVEDGHTKDFEDGEEILGKENDCQNTNISRSASICLDIPHKKAPLQIEKSFDLDPWSDIRDKSSDNHSSRIQEELSTVDKHKRECIVVEKRTKSLPNPSSHEHIPHTSATATANTPQPLPAPSPIHDEGSRLVVKEKSQNPMGIEPTSMDVTRQLDHAIHVVGKGLGESGFEAREKEINRFTTSIVNPYVTNKRKETQKVPHRERNHVSKTLATIVQQDSSNFNAVQPMDNLTINNPLHTQKQSNEKSQVDSICQALPPRTSVQVPEHKTNGEFSSLSLRSTRFEIPSKIFPTAPNESASDRKGTENVNNHFWTNIQQYPMDVNAFHEDFNDNNLTNNKIIETIDTNNVNKMFTGTNRRNCSKNISSDRTWYDKTANSDTTIFSQQTKSKVFTFDNIEESEIGAFDED